jgi:acyl carrier protein
MDELLAILQSLHPDVDFETHTALIDGKVIDSFDIITLVAEISDKMDISIPAEELIPENFNSLAALSSLVQRLSDD